MMAWMSPKAGAKLYGEPMIDYQHLKLRPLLQTTYTGRTGDPHRY